MILKMRNIDISTKIFFLGLTSGPASKRRRVYRPSHEPDVVVEQVEISSSKNRLNESQFRQNIMSTERHIAEATLRHQRERHQVEVKQLQMELEKRKVILELEVETAQLKRDLAKKQLDQR